MNKPLVSIIVPVYNHAAYIQQTIESIITQSYGYAHIQLIVIDDFSTDDSAKVVQELGKVHGFDLVLNTKNKGLCVRPKKSLTKNIGIDGSGVNCLKVLFSFYHLQKLSNFYPSRFRASNTEDIESIKQIKKFYKYENFFLLRYGNKVFEKIINIFTKNPLNQIDEVVLKKYKSELNKTLQF